MRNFPKDMLKRINFDDDFVIVVNDKDEVLYKGIEDDEPMNRENWQWNDKERCYTLDKYKKYCVG